MQIILLSGVIKDKLVSTENVAKKISGSQLLNRVFSSIKYCFPLTSFPTHSTIELIG
jgi:phospholipid N-methyltransferase